MYLEQIKSLSSHKTARWVPGALISIIALATVFRMVRWQDLKHAAATIPLWTISIAAALTLAALAVRAVAWRVLLAWKVGFRHSFFLINLGYFLNNILPLRAGEIGRAIFMGRASGLGTVNVLSSLLVERLFDMAMAAALLLATLPLVLNIAWARTAATLTAVAVVLILVALFLIGRNQLSVRRWVSRSQSLLVQKRIIPILDPLLDGLNAIMRPGRFLLSASLIAICWCLWVCICYVMVLNVSPQFPFYGAIFATAVLAFGISIPAAPGGLGIYEASLVGALAVFGISPSVSLVIALMMRLIQFAVSGIIGFYELLRSECSISGILEQVRSAVQSGNSRRFDAQVTTESK